ncbi:hypothetical protein M378DRAFT_807589 [Amanita muscaria Koide BX008]|uniref:Uncharacterized protein n=1 Tax=Amanita muscaria (strain Koide BX008) TaxID=946122 RepID=A0A0C2X046_AMAMK|nr:hypothetical protein M378DRAFT_807589 [Amanita muscaria Koide BX008]
MGMFFNSLLRYPTWAFEASKFGLTYVCRLAPCSIRFWRNNFRQRTVQQSHYPLYVKSLPTTHHTSYDSNYCCSCSLPSLTSTA